MGFDIFNISRSNPFEASFFHITKWILGFLGFWPLNIFNRMIKFKTILNLTILFISIIGEIRFSWFLRKNPLKALDAICPCLTKMVTLMKLICFLIYRKELKFIFETLYQHLKSDIKDPKKKYMIANVSFFANVWCSLLCLTTLSVNFLYSLKPLIVWGFYYFNGYKNIWVALPFQAALPYEDMTQLNDKTLYSIIYCLLAHSGNVTVFGVSGTDGTFLCFCMYISVSYQCLQEDFKMAFEIHNATGMNAGSNDLLYEDLKILVKRQQSILRMSKCFNEIYQFMIFGHFLFASITLGIILINLLLTSGISRMIYLTYTMAAGSQLYTYCYGAESVNENCLKLSEIVYFCNWYDCDRKNKLLVLFVLAKSQKGSLMRAPFFSPSLALFASIIKTSGSYFTVLQAFL